MLTWTPNPNNLYVIFFMAIGFGLSQSYANGQVRGLFIVHISNNKCVFCFATLFQTLGFCTGFLFSLLTCTYVKVYFYFSLASASLICYIFLIWRENTQNMGKISDEKILVANEIDLRDKITKEEEDKVFKIINDNNSFYNIKF